MKTLEYTPRILTLISAGKKLEAVKMAIDLYGLSLQEAEKMIDSYRPGGLNFYTTFELNTKSDYTPEIAKLINEGKIQDAVPKVKDMYGLSAEDAKKMIDNYPQSKTSTRSVEPNSPVKQEIVQSATNDENILPFCCPNCGSSQVSKSIGGKLEHAAAWAATKGLKSFIFGDYGSYTGGAENTIIKEEVPFQQVCSYCHYTFHARKSQIDAGKYALYPGKAAQLMEAYNKKLQTVKDKEVAVIKASASGNKKRCVFAGVAFLLGLLIYNTCEHYKTDSFLGIEMESATWSFMFSCVLLFFGAIGVLYEGYRCYEIYEEANTIDMMTIQEYAKDHKA